MRPNLAVTVQEAANWLFGGSPALTLDAAARTAILCVVGCVTAMFIGARARP